MKWIRNQLLSLILGCFITFFGTAIQAEDTTAVKEKSDYKWSLTSYVAVSAQNSLGDVLSFQATFPDDTYIGVVALSREVWRYKQWLSFDLEGQVGKFFGDEHQWQFTGLIDGRWHKFPWNKYVNTSFAFGYGLSYNTEVSEVELRDDEDATRLLNYLLFELALGLPKYPRWDLVVRVHHRSEAYGLIGHAGSNYVGAGLKFSF